ncbi:MAG: hypothetical protein PHX08_06680 [Lachnospiraceae bacterium]|nr:hypothetical protein [Lachnospiraceae bacterium]
MEEEYDAMKMIREHSEKMSKMKRKYRVKFKDTLFYVKSKWWISSLVEDHGRAIIFTIILLIITGVLAYRLAPTAITYITKNKLIRQSADIQNEQQPQGYVNDVNYQGFNKTEVYNHPFQISKNYISNKEITYTPEQKKAYIDYASSSMDYLYNLGYHYFYEIDDNADELKNIYASEILFSDSGEPMTIDDYALGLRNSFIESHITLKSTFTTDNSLIWQDNGITYVRGVLKSTPYDANQNGQEFFKNYLHTDSYSVGEAVEQIADIGIVNTQDGLRVDSIRLLK